jgi:glycosyltransferase involved in cell wall biosynthesis
MPDQELAPSFERVTKTSGIPRLCAVVVLYRERGENSRALQSLSQVLSQFPELAAGLYVCIYDNSPDPAPFPSDLLPCELSIFQPHRNEGLAKAYNTALAQAQRRKIAWLLLLDSDTQITSSYLNTALRITGELEADTKVSALVPHIVEAGTIHSPRFASAFRRRPVGLNTSGVMPSEVIALNSGSILRVGAMEALGGFNPEFWLDYLDYWVFRSLQNRGLQIYVLPEQLEHSLSFADAARRMPLERYRNMLEAETYFTARYGSRWERLRLKFVLLKRATRFLTSPDKSFFLLTFRHLFFPGTKLSTQPSRNH